jgi:hypothetical protein
MNHIRVKFYIDTHQVQPSVKNPPRIFCAPHYLHQNMSKKSNQLEWILFHFKELEVLETWLTTTSNLQFKEPEFFVEDRSSRPFIKLLSASNYIKGKCESIEGEWEIEQICKNCSYVKREIASKKRFNLLSIPKMEPIGVYIASCTKSWVKIFEIYFYFNYSWCVSNVEMEDSHFKITLHFEIVDFFLLQTFQNKTPSKREKGRIY